jgi:hypothetical protein
VSTVVDRAGAATKNERRSQVVSAGEAQVDPALFSEDLQTRVRELRAQCAVLRETGEHSHRTALQRCQDSARIRADSRRSHGEILESLRPRLGSGLAG